MPWPFAYVLHNYDCIGTWTFQQQCNAFIHCLMYSYYLYTSFGYTVSIKKWLTRCQLTQFVLCAIQSLLALFVETQCWQWFKFSLFDFFCAFSHQFCFFGCICELAVIAQFRNQTNDTHTHTPTHTHKEITLKKKNNKQRFGFSCVFSYSILFIVLFSDFYISNYKKGKQSSKVTPTPNDETEKKD